MQDFHEPEGSRVSVQSSDFVAHAPRCRPFPGMSPAAPKPRHFRIRLVDGTDLGTMTEERAVELIRQGVIERGDRVQRVGSASWRRADEVAAHVFAKLDREAGEGSFIGEAVDAEPASVWPSAGAAVESEFTATPALQPPPRAPSAWWRRNIVPIVAIAAGIVLALAVSIPLFVSQARARAAREFNASLVAESDSLVEGAEKGDPTSLLPQFDACLVTFTSPKYPLDEQTILRRAALESARSRLYWSTRRLEPEFAKVEALAGRATAAAETGDVPSAEALVSQARGALPRLPAPLPATIDARRAGKPLLAIEAAESAIRTAKEAEAARDRAVRLPALTVAGGLTDQSIIVPTWATPVEAMPDPAVVTNSTLRAAITATGLAWRVRDTATQMEMLLVPAGTFTMGCTASNQDGCYNDEIPTHSVTLTQAFYLGRYEVTQGQWVARMGSNPSSFQGASYPDAANRPVENVSWDTIHGYLSMTGMRLPSEAEWEYACRAGTTTAFNDGSSDDASVGNIAWYRSNSSNQTHAVGGKAANALGLYDMSGNVYEWVNDLYLLTYYSVSPSTNPLGPVSGTKVVLRGGSWINDTDTVRSSCRGSVEPYIGISCNGFRVARAP
jgi:formylglycine-generating enzyme required for sulfatase activity